MARKVDFDIPFPDRKNPQDVMNYKREYQKKYKSLYRKKKKHVMISLEPEEHDRLKECAQKEGKPLTKYIMDSFYSHETKVECKNKGYYICASQLNKIGVNVNQIAKRINSNPDSLPDHLIAIENVRNSIMSVKNYLASRDDAFWALDKKNAKD